MIPEDSYKTCVLLECIVGEKLHIHKFILIPACRVEQSDLFAIDLFTYWEYFVKVLKARKTNSKVGFLL